jgi:hypothetical protein
VVVIFDQRQISESEAIRIDEYCFKYANEKYCRAQAPTGTVTESSNGTSYGLLLFAAIAIACLILFLIQFRLYKILQKRHSALLESKSKKRIPVDPPAPPPPPPPHQFDKDDSHGDQRKPTDEMLFRFNSTIFRTSKSDETIESCADWANANHDQQTFTIADGVSQTFNSSKWAEILVARADSTKNLKDFIDDVERFAEDWEADCSSLLTDEDPHSFVRQKQQQGAQSTFANLRLVKRGKIQFWQFSTIGDSLLVVLDTSEGFHSIKRLAPWSKLDSFPGSPDVVASKIPYIRGHLKSFEYPASENQELLLMTDALARYLVSRASIESEIDELFPFLNKSEASFQTWVDSARADGLQDDDSTLIHIYLSND